MARIRFGQLARAGCPSSTTTSSGGTWNRIGDGSLDLHGHSHNMLKPAARQFDVGVDAWDFTPVTLAQMREGRRGWLKAQRAQLPESLAQSDS